jgi:hypothetical protein
MPHRDAFGDSSSLPHVYRVLPVLASLAAMLAATAAAQQPAPRPTTRFTVSMRTYGQIHRDAAVRLEFDVSAVRASPAAEFHIRLPSSVRIVAGDSSWEGSLGAGERRVFSVVVALNDTGIYRVGGWISDTTTDSARGLVKESIAGLYFAVGRTTGFAANDLDERFVPPGRRALWALEHVSEEDLGRSSDATSERQVYGSSGGIGVNAVRLGRALRAIDSA